MHRIKLSSKIIVLLLLQCLIINALRTTQGGGVIQQRVTRLQQSGLLDLEGTTEDESVGEDSGTPESGTDSNDSDNDADALSTNVRTFDPATTLGWVASYMEETDDNPEEFWPDFTFIAKSSTGNAENEVALIQSSFAMNQGEEEGFYRNLITRLNNPTLGVYDSMVGVALVTDTVEEPISLKDLFDNVYHLPGEYDRVHEVLNLQDEANILSLGWEHYVGDNGLNVGPYCLAYHEIDTEYNIEGGTIYLNTLVVDGLDYRSLTSQVTYRGYLRLNDYFGVSPFRLENIDRNIPVEIRTMSDTIRDSFELDNPQFQIFVNPEGQQIDIEIFMRNIFTLIEMQVPPPRGLSSLKYLGFEEARLTIESGESQRVILRATPPDFDFVSEDISIQDVDLELDFRAWDRYEITFNGTTNIDSVAFNTTIIRDAQDEDYHVYMVDSENQIISYSQLESYLIPSISTHDLHLHPDVVSYPYLSNLQITQGGLHLTDPNVTMQFQPYMIYRIEGYHDTDEDDIINCFVQATYATLDGDVLIHYRYVFDYDESQALLLRTFDINSGDAATRGIVISQFSLDTYNRDFNFSQYEEYLDDTNSGHMWERGTRVTVGIDYPITCDRNSFCNFLRHKSNVTEEIRLTGYIDDPITTLSYNLDDTFMTPFLNLTNPSVDLLIITREEGGNLLKMRIRGDLQIMIEPDRFMYSEARFLYFDEDVEHFQLTSESNAIYENLFGLDHLIDLVDSNFIGTGNFEGNLLRYNMTSMSVIGRDCYLNRELLDALTHQNDNTVGDASYHYGDDLEDYNNFIDVEHCTIGRTTIRLRDEVQENSFYSYYNIQSVRRLMNIVMNAFDGEFLPEILQEINMGDGVSVNATYGDIDPTEADLDRELTFIGNMNWYGLQRRGDVNAHVDQNYANLTLNLTSFSVGNGNLRFVTLNDISAFMNTNLGADIPWEINRHRGGGHNVTGEANTLTAGMEGSNLQSTVAYLNSNIMIFDQFRRISVPISDELVKIEILGRPFYGVFEAKTTVMFTPEDNIEDETNSMVSIFLTDTERLREVSDRARDLILDWVDQIINSFVDMQNKMDEINQSLDNLDNQVFAEDTCPEITRCESEPVLTCTDFATEVECTHTSLVCDETQYSCVEQEDQCQFAEMDGTCIEAISVCTRWEYTCVGGFTELCSEYEDLPNEDECREFGFICELETVLQPEWVGRSRLFNDRIERNHDDLDVVTLFQDLTTEIYESASEMVNLDSHDDLVEIAYANATQSLGHIRSANEIMFTFGTRMFDGWTRRYFSMIHSSELVNELEESTIAEEESQDLGIVKLRSTIDFDSTERTSRMLATQIISSVCDLYHIHAEESRRIQQSLQHFGYLDGNTTIWSLYNVPSNPIHAANIEEDGSEASPVEEEEAEPVSLDEIYSTEGEEDEIFTYVYNYNAE